jgi:hypothetical protein
MKNGMKAYDQLLMDETLLQQELKLKQQAITGHVRSLKAKVQPAAIGMGIAKTILTRNGMQPIAQGGLDILIDLMTKKLLFRKSGWIAKMILPPLLKNISSHALTWKVFNEK